MAKDRFSQQAAAYARYRPGYPEKLFEYILSFVKERKTAWDCATGNGQAALMLSSHFEKVEATDISEAQLNNAVQKENIRYTKCPAEKTHFADNSFDLITVATAYHWLNWQNFHTEATRVGKKNAVIAVWAYHLLYCKDEAINNIINHFYFEITHSYWDKERQYVDEKYGSVDFNFAPLPSREFELPLYWDKEGFLGYLSSWSAVQRFINEKTSSPLALIEDSVRAAWTEENKKEFRFPIFMRMGRITK